MRRSSGILVPVFLGFLAVSVHGWAGGFHQESTDDPKIQKVVDFAFRQLESGTNNYFQRQIIQVKEVRSQLIAGKKYEIKLHVGDTNCTAPSSPEEEAARKDDVCSLNSRERQEECILTVWTKVWENFEKLTDFSCQKIIPAVKNDKEKDKNYYSEHYNQLLSNPKSVRQLAKLQSSSHFKSFMKKHGKNYADVEEYNYRFNIFKENMKKVQFLRETEMGTGHYGASPFADLSEHEYKTQKLGFKPELKKDDVHWPTADVPDVPLPKSFDWRSKGAVTPVKNQGSCGSCWAFSVTGNVEGLWFQKTKKLISLSEQELVDCDKRDSGCNGGLPDNAYKSIIELGGLEAEGDYEYDGKGETCHFSKNKVKALFDRAVDMPTNETQIAQWLITHGPISIGLNANAMQFYMGGVSHPFKFLCSPSGIDHGVLIVGYGIHKYPLFKKDMPYWIIKNSWGASWGEQGYYRLYRGDGSCGVNQMASSSIFYP